MKSERLRKQEIRRAFEAHGLKVVDIASKLHERDWLIVTYIKGQVVDEIYVYENALEAAERAAASINETIAREKAV